MTRTPRALVSTDMLRANLPEKYWSATLEAVPQSAPHLRPVANYLVKLETMLAEGYGLYLWSVKNGTGKTALAAIAGRRALSLGYTVLYSRSQAFKDAVAKDLAYDDTRSVNERARDVDLLILDDLGKEYRTESGFAQNIVEDLIRERVQRNKATIITTNVEPEHLSGFFTVDLAEVLKESVGIIEVVGKDKGGKDWRAERRATLKATLFDA